MVYYTLSLKFFALRAKDITAPPNYAPPHLCPGNESSLATPLPNLCSKLYPKTSHYPYVRHVNSIVSRSQRPLTLSAQRVWGGREANT